MSAISTISHWLLSLIVLWGIPSPRTNLCYAKSYYVTPYLSHHDCPPEEKCYTINEYAQEDRFTGDDQISLYFLGGVHNLTVGDFVIDNKVGLELLPAKVQTFVTIQMLNSSSIQIQSIQDVVLSGLELLVSYKEAEDGKDLKSCLSFTNVDTLLLTVMSTISCQLSVREATKINLDNFNASATSFYVSLNVSNQVITKTAQNTSLSINSSALKNSFVMMELEAPLVHKLEIFNTSITSQSKDNPASGVKIETSGLATLYADITNCTIVGNHQGINISANASKMTVLSVEHCHIENNGNDTDAGQAGGIAVAQRGSSLATSVKIISTTLFANTFPQLFVIRESGSGEVTVFNSTIIKTNRDFFACGSLFDGVGILIYVGEEQHTTRMLINLTQNLFVKNPNAVSIQGKGGVYELFFKHNNVSDSCYTCLGIFSSGAVDISSSIFTLNEGRTSVYINSSVDMTIRDSNITQNQMNGIMVCTFSSMIAIIDCTFSDNYGTSILVEGLHPIDKNNVTFLLDNVLFNNNTSQRPDNGVVQVSQIDHLRIGHLCEFSNNRGTPVQALTASVSMSGTITFRDNIAYHGGAISLSQSALSLMFNNSGSTNVLLRNNTAVSGGGIFIDGPTYIDLFTGSSCFYEINGASLDELKHSRITMNFLENEAYVGGNDLYGAALNSDCMVSLNDNSKTDYGSIRDYIFQTPEKFLSISSNPRRVCLYVTLQL